MSRTSPRWLLLALIRAYQRWISPHKGFSCAYRVHTGRASCSALGYRAVRRHGVFEGLDLIHKRTKRCALVHRQYQARRSLHLESGFLDAACLGDCMCNTCCSCACDPGVLTFFLEKSKATFSVEDQHDKPESPPAASPDPSRK